MLFLLSEKICFFFSYLSLPRDRIVIQLTGQHEFSYKMLIWFFPLLLVNRTFLSLYFFSLDCLQFFFSVQIFLHDANPDPDPDPPFHYLMPIQIQIQILPQVIHKLEIRKFFYFYSQQCKFKLFYLSYQCNRCHNFYYFGQHIQFLWKNIVYRIYLRMRIRIHLRMRIARPWMPIPIRIRIRQKYVDPIGSGSTTQAKPL